MNKDDHTKSLYSIEFRDEGELYDPDIFLKLLSALEGGKLLRARASVNDSYQIEEAITLRGAGGR